MVRDVELTFEVVSPLFIGGADPRGGDPEVEGLRVPSLRGALRYWFRALLAAPDRCVLAEEEAKQFGSAERPSPLVVRVEPLGAVRPVSWDDVRRMVRASASRGAPRAGGWSVSGIGYLGDVALRSIRSTRAREAIPPGSRYRVLLVWRRRTGPERQEAERLAATLWLLSRFGALGTRARRGFGAIQVVEVKDIGFLAPSLDSLKLPIGAASPGELVRELQQGCAALRGLRLASSPVGEYPNLSVCEAKVLGDRSFRGWQDALEWVGSEYRAFRSAIHPLRRRIPFGLPIPQRGGRPLSEDGLNRRGSPLRLRPVKLASGSYALLAILFKDRLFPSLQADHTLPQEFLEGLGGSPIAL